MEPIRKFVKSIDKKTIRKFDILLQLMILTSLIGFSLETLPDLSSTFRSILRYIEIVTVMIFTLEYVARVVAAPKKLKFIFSFYGIIDLLAIVPFFISTDIDLRSLRLFRFFRLIWILKLVRYSAAARRLQIAFSIAKEEIVMFLFVTVLFLYLSSVGIFYFENSAQPEVFSSVFASMWWAVTTLTTVGYGDIYPVTTGGKVFTFFILMIGLGVVSIPAGLLASALSEAREVEEASK